MDLSSPRCVIKSSKVTRKSRRSRRRNPLSKHKKHVRSISVTHAESAEAPAVSVAEEAVTEAEGTKMARTMKVVGAAVSDAESELVMDRVRKNM